MKKLLRPLYSRARRNVVRFARLFYYAHDFMRVGRHMTLWPSHRPPEEQLAAKLFFFYHKLEKGLSMPGQHRLFGVPVVREVMALLVQWEQFGYRHSAPAYRGALAALGGYLNRLETENLDSDDDISTVLSTFLGPRLGEPLPEDQTPVVLTVEHVRSAACLPQIEKLYATRRSYRDFDCTAVPDALVARSVELAQLSPSVCNRQASKVYAISDPGEKERALSYQNGNRGFGHTAAQVLVVTSDLRFFTDAAERNQPYVDGGLFAMSLIYALQAQGVVSCCLNWCATEATDQAFHKEFGLPDFERVIMFIAIGNPKTQAFVPRSHRREASSVFTKGLAVERRTRSAASPAVERASI